MALYSHALFMKESTKLLLKQRSEAIQKGEDAKARKLTKDIRKSVRRDKAQHLIQKNVCLRYQTFHLPQKKEMIYSSLSDL